MGREHQALRDVIERHDIEAQCRGVTRDGNETVAAAVLTTLDDDAPMLAGTAALQSAFLFTHRRFAPTAFYQASLNCSRPRFLLFAILIMFRSNGRHL